MSDVLDDFKLPPALKILTDLDSWQIHFGDKKCVDSFWDRSSENPKRKRRGREEHIATVYDILLEALQNRLIVRDLQINGNPALVKLLLEQRENMKKAKKDKV